MERVSILVPVYGAEKYIEKCAISLFEQTYENIEYVFVNDSTKDNSIIILRNILQKYPNRQSQVRIIEHGYNQGVAAARNTAIDNLTGDYFMFVDSDDYIELTAVELLVKQAIKDNADITICDFFLVNKDKTCVRQHYYSDDRNNFVETILMRKAEPALWGRLFRSDFYRNSGVKFIEGLDFGEDFCVIVRLVYIARKISKINTPLYHYIQYNVGSLTKNITRRSVDSLAVIDGIIEKFFFDKPLFKDIVVVSMLRNKLSLIKMSDVGMYGYISNVYRNIDFNRESLGFADRLLMFLFDNRLYYGAYLYCKIGLCIASLVR